VTMREKPTFPPNRVLGEDERPCQICGGGGRVHPADHPYAPAPFWPAPNWFPFLASAVVGGSLGWLLSLVIQWLAT
jgi:hypothetical protein